MDMSAHFDEDIRRELDRFKPPRLNLHDVPGARSALREHLARVSGRGMDYRAEVVVLDQAIPSAVEEHDIPIRLYRPAAADGWLGALIYLHGGAFVLGDLDLEDEHCCRLAIGANCAVVSVDYRRAPEHPFPVPLHDAASALQWVAQQAELLLIDPARLGVGGCSAGGALAAGLAQLNRDQGGPRLKLQLLLCPVLDASMSRPSIAAFSTEEDRAGGELMWAHYLQGMRGDAPPYASPFDTTDLTNLPPAYVSVPEFDALRDEGIEYAHRLLLAGVSTELHVWPRVPHAFELFAPDSASTWRSVDSQCQAIGSALG